MLAPVPSALPTVPLSSAAGPSSAGAASAPFALIAPVATKLHIYSSQLDVLGGQQATVAGALLDDRHRGLAGDVVLLQALGARGWSTLTRARTRSSGRFTLRYVPQGLISEAVRVRFSGDASARPSRRPAGTLNSYHLAMASWYGGGGTMACGGTLTSSTLGVANKTLPCGTLVTLRYDGRSVQVPVVDRGPYVAGREFDLTEATKRALGFEGVGEIWSTR